MLVEVLRMCMDSETGAYEELDCSFKDFKKKKIWDFGKKRVEWYGC
jgi:hypothetical protein